MSPELRVSEEPDPSVIIQHVLNETCRIDCRAFKQLYNMKIVNVIFNNP
jgi:hypothetical protein